MENTGSPIKSGSAARLQQANEHAGRRDRWIRIRMLSVGGMLALGFFLVFGRAADLHLREQESLKWVASRQYRAVIPTAPRRGKIVDAKGKDLAIDVPVFSIYADPRHIGNIETALAALQQVLPLGAEAKDLAKRVRQGKKFVWIKRRVDAATADRVRALKIRGIASVEETKRFYPNGALASQVLGAVGYDAEPLAGMELALNRYLASERGETVYQRDARGKVFYTPKAVSETRDLANVELTIDKVIQYYAEDALVRTVAAAQARSGVAVVVEVATGRVLAMASMPSFDPNDYARYDQSRWRNRAITDTYEPGSTFKVFIAAGAIEAGMSPERKFDCEKGQIKIGTAVLHDHDPYGMLSLNDIIKVSSNIGALKVAQAIGRDRFAETLRAFHIGQATGVDYPGEVGGILRDPNRWQPVEMATIAFGQGVTATPLQMTMAFAAIANGGRLMKPYMVERVRRDDGTLLYEGAPEVVSTPIQPTTARILSDMLVRVVEKGGTAPKAASEMYPVAGKTGTAQKVVEGSGRYAGGKFYASFVGFAPADAPKIAVYVGIDEPKGPHFGGVVAGPVFKEITEATLQYLGVPGRNAPMMVMNRQPPTLDPGPGTRDQDLVPKNVSSPESRVPSPESSFFTSADKDRMTVPNLIGLPIREIVRRAGQSGVRVRVAGMGMAVEQQPAAGQVLPRGGLLAVRCAVPE